MMRSTSRKKIQPADDSGGTCGRLVRAAAELLRAGGPAAASARAICDAAGVRAPTLYHHFGDLAGLHRAVVDAAFSEHLRRKNARQAKSGGDPLDDIRRGWDGYVQFALDQPALFAVISAEVLAARHPPESRPGYRMLIAEITRLADQHPLRYSVAVAAHLVWASSHGTAIIALAGDSAVGRSAAFRTAAREAMLRDLFAGPSNPAARKVR